MEKIDEQLKNIPLVEVPIGMHQLVMRKINHKKLQPFILFIFAFFVLNFIIIVWHINAKLIDAEFTNMMRDFLDIFSFNFSFIKIFLLNFFEIISPLLVISASVSMLGAVYAGRKINFYYFSKI